MQSINAGDIVKILPSYQDEGDDQLIWVAVENEQQGKVKVTPSNATLHYKPVYVMLTEWLTK